MAMAAKNAYIYQNTNAKWLRVAHMVVCEACSKCKWFYLRVKGV
jgi:hypothetical protein